MKKLPFTTHARLAPKKLAADALFYLAGTVLYALAVNIFTAPNNVVPGGVTGVATLLNYLFGLPIGTLIFIINLPLFFLSWRFLGREFTVRTILVTTVGAAIIDVLAPFVPPFHGDSMLVAVFGGVLAGAGLGLIYMRGATTGGSEIVARLLERRFHHIPIGRLILAVDGVVVAAAAVVYQNVESALYAMVMIFVSSSVMDALVYGSDSGKMLLVMTGKEREIADDILKTMGRGVTMLNATGAYTGDERRVLLVAIRPSELYQLRTLVEEHDPAAFMIVTSTDEVLGKGFKSVQE